MGILFGTIFWWWMGILIGEDEGIEIDIGTLFPISLVLGGGGQCSVRGGIEVFVWLMIALAYHTLATRTERTCFSNNIVSYYYTIL